MYTRSGSGGDGMGWDGYWGQVRHRSNERSNKKNFLRLITFNGSINYITTTTLLTTGFVRDK